MDPKDIIVLKFGGSSVADNLKLNVVAKKIIDLYNKNNKIVVVVSAQGKTTDNLLNQAKELSSLPNERELDTLVSTGEQISMSKLSILLNELGYESISLTGWQAGIYTSNLNQNSKIENIDTTRIEEELEKDKIVIVAGFQGINEKGDITTLGRGGSDTTAVAIAAALKAKHCYIFSDVDGVYTTDPNKISIAKKLEVLSYEEMLEIANEGAKVLHTRCIEIGKKYKVPIITKSTFNNKPGTLLQDKIEDTNVKSIVKNDDIIIVKMKYDTYLPDLAYKLFYTMNKNNIEINNFINNSNHSTEFIFTINSQILIKFQSLLETELKGFETTYSNITKIAIIGYGIKNDKKILEKTMEIIELNKLEILYFEINESKISILFNQKIPNAILEQLHKTLL